LNYLLDTNVVSELSKKIPNSDVVACINALPEDGMYISVVILGEIIKGNAGPLQQIHRIHIGLNVHAGLFFPAVAFKQQ
jgi:predicted nucleic acid-binding protein